MKAEELRKLTAPELETKLGELKKELPARDQPA